ncbi:uncharacterized protein KLLA0_D00269g [Kluyveromyces lactis]|uniref:KLLA0D00269p n=1 Tax=Kluyveromyces lactis (strain ATCC 8585 / CBS 2359 / DSM 70799 / NBRC 1267 / NRRL Y-1140 / WM37) TaxID=284590 RepID=B5FV71_KLULA|nr:uncharacterized protein KLLA0_D00269g [Kluyveromyces lactis]CAR64372.1 KLLA0D00269p [Kluyveromyces lactis]|eukprot:XP_002999368.1 uncharacterized protein KLLA0_D00269g [Kluyveromyces lactis]
MRQITMSQNREDTCCVTVCNFECSVKPFNLARRTFSQPWQLRLYGRPQKKTEVKISRNKNRNKKHSSKDLQTFFIAAGVILALVLLQYQTCFAFFFFGFSFPVFLSNLHSLCVVHRKKLHVQSVDLGISKRSTQKNAALPIQMPVLRSSDNKIKKNSGFG